MARTARAADSRSHAPSGSAPTTGGFDSGTLLRMMLPPLFGPGGFQFGEDALDLQKVIRVMSGEQTREVGNRFPAPLAVHAVVVPDFGSDLFEHGEIVLAQHAKYLERAPEIAVPVLEYRNPLVLVEWLNRDPVFTNDGAHPPTGHDLDVGKMSDDFGNRPLRGLRAPF